MGKSNKENQEKGRGQYQEKLDVNGGFLDIIKAAGQQLITKAQNKILKINVF